MSDISTFILNFPLERPHCGVPLANGNFGTLVWGKETLNITINQNDLWDHRGGELIDERDNYERLIKIAEESHYGRELNESLHRTQTFVGRPRRMAVGRFEFRFADGVKPLSAELVYDTGRLNIKLSSGKQISLVLVLKQNTLYLEDPADSIAGITLRPASDFPKTRQFNEERGSEEKFPFPYFSTKRL